MTNGPETPWHAFRALDPRYQITAVVLALVVLVVACSGVGAAVSRWKDARFDAAASKRASFQRDTAAPTPEHATTSTTRASTTAVIW